MKVSNKVRRVFAPLNINSTYAVSGSPLAQVYNSNESAHEPNRSIVPTIITPNILVHDTDAIFDEGNVNRKLGSIKWYVNGVDVTTLADYTNGLYSIDTSDTSSRGTLTIYKNVAAASPAVLSFRAILPDTRTSTNITVTLDHILLSTTDVAPDKYTIEIDQPVDNTYNPIALASHLYSVSAVVFLGDDKLTSFDGLTFALYYMSGTNKVLCASDNSPEVLSLTGGAIQFDLRLIGKRDYFFQLLKEGIEMAAVQFSIQRKYPAYTVNLRDYGDVRKNQVIIPSSAVIHAGKSLVTDPGQYFAIVWKTYSAVVGTVEHNMGEHGVIDAARTGINQGVVEVYCEVEEKPAMQVASDAMGEVYTDSNSEPYIFN